MTTFSFCNSINNPLIESSSPGLAFIVRVFGNTRVDTPFFLLPNSCFDVCFPQKQRLLFLFATSQSQPRGCCNFWVRIECICVLSLATFCVATGLMMVCQGNDTLIHPVVFESPIWNKGHVLTVLLVLC